MPDLKYAHVLDYVYSNPWAIRSEMLATILDLLAFRASGGRLTDEEITERIGAVAKPVQRTANNIAVLPLFGVIGHRMGMMTEMSGGTSTERFTQAFRQALASPDVGAILLDVDSPGGTVQGVQELADEIYQSRGQKPIVAIANSEAASAAYWLATAAEELYVIPSGQVGSIGVFAAHQDLSAAYEQEGVKTTLISAGKYKVDGNPYGPLSEEAKGDIQEKVDAYYDAFVKAVARNRGASVADVRGGFGEGRMVLAKDAKKQGMVDDTMTMDEAMQRTMRRMGKQGTRAEGDWVEYEGNIKTLTINDTVIVPDDVPQPEPDVYGSLDLRRRRLRLAAKQSRA